MKYKNLKSNRLSHADTTIPNTSNLVVGTLSEKQAYSVHYTNNLIIEANQSAEKERGGINVVELFEFWTTTYRNMSCEKNVDYSLMKKMLVRWRISSVDDVVIKLQNEKLSESTFNRRLTMLKQFFNWLVKKKHIVENPLEDVSRKRRKKKEIATRRPFSIGQSN